jgi:TrmH family RNA methyltransferase
MHDRDLADIVSTRILHYVKNMVIVSQQNPKVKYVRRLQGSGRFRRKERAFVAEGTRWLSEIILSAGEIRFVLFTQDWGVSEDHRQLLDRLSSEVVEVSSEVMRGMSELETSEGILAVLPIMEHPLPEKPSMLLVADGISDPGNLGTMIRTAAAAGTDGVILAPGCVDAYNPKVVRGGMGAHLQFPIHRRSWPQIASLTSHMSNWVAASGDNVSYDQVDWKEPSSLIAGNEAIGAGETARQMFKNRVSIPMLRPMDSLNVAVASGIILFEAARQRSAVGAGSDA